MLERFLNSKFIQKIKSVKHIEIYIVVLFVLLLLIIYFVNFGEKKDEISNSTNINTITQSNFSSSVFAGNDESLINISQNYKEQVENTLTNLIINTINKNVKVSVLLSGGEILYSLDTSKDTNFTNDNISISANGGAIIINYEPEILKVIITNCKNLDVENKIIITDLIKNYLSISTNKIFMY